ncbi:binding-protein-dependent transport systems inner membrane component [Caballeronia hypogeia]|uniref:Binding-protein-dependent transport systems inner membrane component n=1 Tax=Caballeronia hypogeia TaxID=1777140 RepID=A0A158CZ00_9BURK|nr:ABC transporter permease [Caballeronia hypogeia]SAK87563.1 binding-protein-dependent transport systems inner membrane component [Caballeronia hypogeia]
MRNVSVQMPGEALQSALPENQTALARGLVFEQLRLGALLVPALVLVLVVLVAPIAWLAWQSAFDLSGALSFENYARLATPVYRNAFFSTFQMSALVTVLVLLLGYPLAYMLSQLPARVASACMVFVVLPFWTSTLVRTYAWMVLLQRTGLVNTWLINLHLIDHPLQLVNNFTGTAIGMTHVMLPCLVLPLYSAMKAVDPVYMRAAANCGATPVQAFWQAYFPMTLPGLSAGVVLVFVLCLGFYVTPALLGGGRINMLSMQIQNDVAMSGNPGAASALGVVLVILTMIVLAAIGRLFGLERMYGGK